MNLHERLMADLQAAMRSQDSARKDAIRMVRAAIKNAEIDWQREASDEEIQKLISTEVKRRREAIELFRQGGRADLVTSEEAQIAILAQYLPTQLSEEQIAEIIQRVIRDLGATGLDDLGAVMRQVMAQVKNQADGRLVSTLVRQILGRKAMGAS